MPANLTRFVITGNRVPLDDKINDAFPDRDSGNDTTAASESQANRTRSYLRSERINGLKIHCRCEVLHQRGQSNKSHLRTVNIRKKLLGME